MHQKCFDEYVLTAYQCPTCWKSITDMRIYFSRIDALVAQQKMPVEYENYVSKILCNDCVKQSTVKYHFLYHKCPYCEGYNTKVIETKELSSCCESSNIVSFNNNDSAESSSGETSTTTVSNGDGNGNGNGINNNDNNGNDGTTSNSEINDEIGV